MLFVKTELQNLHFSVCHVVSRLVIPSFSMADSLISADVLSTARERYKNTFSKVIFQICCNKNRLEAGNIFLREESIAKSQKRQKKIRVGDLNLGTVGNRKHTYFLFGLTWSRSVTELRKKGISQTAVQALTFTLSSEISKFSFSFWLYAFVPNLPREFSK